MGIDIRSEEALVATHRDTYHQYRVGVGFWIVHKHLSI